MKCYHCYRYFLCSRCLSKVVEEAPYVTTIDTLDQHKCDFCVHGGAWDKLLVALECIISQTSLQDWSNKIQDRRLYILFHFRYLDTYFRWLPFGCYWIYHYLVLAVGSLVIRWFFFVRMPYLSLVLVALWMIFGCCKWWSWLSATSIETVRNLSILTICTPPLTHTHTSTYARIHTHTHTRAICRIVYYY